jgi:hypothetical protein
MKTSKQQAHPLLSVSAGDFMPFHPHVFLEQWTCSNLIVACVFYHFSKEIEKTRTILLVKRMMMHVTNSLVQ